MDRYFDLIYSALVIGILLALSYSIFASVNLYRNPHLVNSRRRALGIIYISIGTAIALLGGLFADSFLKNSTYFQQARFTMYYAGFILITLGFMTIVAASRMIYILPKYLSNSQPINFVVWFLFLGTLLISAFYVVNPTTFIRNQYGVQTQQAIYFYPMLIATLLGFVLMFLVAFAIKKPYERSPLFGLGAYAALVFLGLLRESLILPDLGNPLVDLLVAFVPFFVGSLCLCYAVTVFRKPIS